MCCWLFSFPEDWRSWLVDTSNRTPIQTFLKPVTVEGLVETTANVEGSMVTRRVGYYCLKKYQFLDPKKVEGFCKRQDYKRGCMWLQRRKK
jgi:hypothetical protein